MADSRFGNELRCGFVDELFHCGVMERDLVVETPDPSSDRPHRVAGTTLGDWSLRCVSERGAALDQRFRREVTQLVSKIVGCGQHEGFEFVDRSRAGAHDAGACHGMHTQGFSMPVVCTRNVEPVATERFASGAHGIEFVGLRAVFAGFLAWPIELDHPLADTRKSGGEPASVTGGALDGPRSLTLDGELFGPADGVVVAGGVG